MALGTPVSGTVAYSAQNGTSVAPTYPASILATDTLVMFLGMKPSTANGGTVTTPSGWTLRDSLTGAGGYGATLGADTGNTNLYVYTKDVVTAGLSGAVTVTVATNNVSWAAITRVPSTNGAFSYGSAEGSRTTAPTAGVAFGVTLTDASPTTAFTSGDVSLWAMCIPTDIGAGAQFTVPTMAATGATFAAGVELREATSGTGNDIGGYLAYANCTAGASSTAPTATVTAAGTVTNVRGPIVALRIREIAGATQNLTPSLFTNTNQFFSATVSQTNPVENLTPDLYTNINEFFSATILQFAPDQNLTPTLFTNTQTFYSPSRTSSNAVAPSLLTNTQIFYSPTATRLNTVAPALYTNTQTFFAPAVTTTRTVEASLFTNTQTFYGPTASATRAILPSLFTNEQTFYSPVVAVAGGSQELAPSLFVNTNIIYLPTVVDPPAQLIGGGGGEDSSSSKPRATKRKKTGFANERAKLEASLSTQVEKNVEVLSDSNLAAAKKTAKSLNAYLNEKGTADALQKQLDKLLAQLGIKSANDQNNDSLNADLKAAADEIQEFLYDEQEAIEVLLLDQENDDALLLMAMGF